MASIKSKGTRSFASKLKEAIEQGGGTVGPKKVSVGFLEGATYPDGTSVATVAAAQEFGTDTIPPRPFFRSMVAAKQGEWGPALAVQLTKTGFDVEKSLRRAGEGIKGQLQQSILDTNSPPLAESTVKAKGFDKPLIDTGVMLRSVDYRVD